MQAQVLEGGFAEPAIEAAHAFRHVMEAMARPGQIEEVTGATPPEPMSVAAGVVVLTLCDPETPIYLAGTLDCDAVRSWIAFHTGAPFTGPSHASFAIGTWEALGPLAAYPVGTPEYPDRSATLIVETAQLEAQGATLCGPGIKETAALSLPETAAFQTNAQMFPLGLDFIFTSGSRLAALPRSTEVR